MITKQDDPEIIKTLSPFVVLSKQPDFIFQFYF